MWDAVIFSWTEGDVIQHIKFQLSLIYFDLKRCSLTTLKIEAASPHHVISQITSVFFVVCWLIIGDDVLHCFRLALGSFVEEYNNKVQIVSLDEDTSEFSAKSTFDHPYPTTKIMWIPDSVSILCVQMCLHNFFCLIFLLNCKCSLLPVICSHDEGKTKGYSENTHSVFQSLYPRLIHLSVTIVQ